MHKKRTKLYIFISFIILSSTTGIQAQNQIKNKTNAPYSRFGLGEMFGSSYHPYNLSLGGLSQTMRNNNILNPENPASYTAISTGSFVFDIGFLGEGTKSQSQKEKGHWEGSANVSHILFGFPIVEKYKMSFGFLPYSMTSYSSSKIVTMDSTIGRVQNSFDGEGGINKVYWGHAVELIENLSIGGNAEFLFGNVRHINTVFFLDSSATGIAAGMFNAERRQSVRMANFSASLGAQYQLPMGTKHQWGIGATYSIPTQFTVKSEEVGFSYKGNEIIGESYDTTIKRKIRLPQVIGVGISFQELEKWMIGLDVKYTSWENHLFLDEPPANKVNNLLTSLGAEMKGNLSAMNYLNRISLRTGIHYEYAAYKIDGNRVDDIGIHAGASFPMRKSRSVINLSFMYGILGKSSNGLIKENYFKIGISLSTSDRWFMKRKYD